MDLPDIQVHIIDTTSISNEKKVILFALYEYTYIETK